MHTFQVKNKAPFKVVIKHLHPTRKLEKNYLAPSREGASSNICYKCTIKVQTQTKKDKSILRNTVKTSRLLLFVELTPNATYMKLTT